MFPLDYFGVFFTGFVLNRVLTDNIVINEKAMRSKKTYSIERPLSNQEILKII